MESPQEPLATLATFSFPMEAFLLQSRLESAGVWSIVVDAETVTMNWLLSVALGGVKVKVRPQDLDQARNLMEVEEGDALQPLLFAEDEHCPECGSVHIRFDKYNRRFAFLTWLFLSFPLPVRRNKWTCRDCGHVWKE